ncbi:MAG: glycosyltransferase family 4 protein [Clostridiales bacterium]|nr:glycosyltransferase family 4 protein [Clostridiales bacterium]
MEKRYKILEVIDHFHPNITSEVRAVDNYAKNMYTHSDITVATLGVEQDIYNYVPYHVICSGSNRATRSLYNMLYKGDYDIIHMHSIGKLSDMMIKLARAKDIPVVATLHHDYTVLIRQRHGIGLIANIKIKKLIKTLNALDEVFVSSPYVAEDLRAIGFNGKVSYLPLGSDLSSKLKKSELAKIANAEYNIGDELVFVSMGNVRETKRIDFALRALKILKDRKIRFRYFVLGKGDAIPLLSAVAKELGIMKNVHFLGYTPDEMCCALLARADLLLYPTTYDIYALAKIEAAGFKTAGVYIKDSFVSNEVFDGVNGYVSDNNEKSYANRIYDAIMNTKELKMVGINAYNDLYVTWADATKMLYNRLVGIMSEHEPLNKYLRRRDKYERN